jgi:O-antigen/teichoic acid export membrane protein
MSVNAAVAGRRGVVARDSRAGGVVGMWLLGAAMVASGVLTYGYLILAARTLGAEKYGQIGVLWGAIFIAAIIIFRPLEQTTSRAIANRLAREDEVRSVIRSVVVITAVILLAGGAVAAIAWHTLTSRLFLGDDTMTVCLLLGIAAYGLAYLVRGLLGGVRWFKGYGLGLLADSAARLLAAAPLVFVASRGIAAAAMVAAGLGGAVVPLVVGRRKLTGLARRGRGEEFKIRSALAFAGPATVIAASDQLLVNGGPIVVIASGGSSRTAGIVFAATMLVRAPVYVFQGLAASLLPNLTHLHATESRHLFRRAVARTAAILLGAGAIMVIATASAGSGLMQSLYGADFIAGRPELALLAASVAFYLPAGTFAQALLALDRGRSAAASWAAAAVIFVVAYAAVPGDPLLRISIGLALALLINAVVLGSLLVLGTGLPDRKGMR